MKRIGKVVMVGAGPGDPGLLTLKGKRRLETADVVVYDRLICPELLDYAPQAEKIDVGKSRGRHPVPQEEINEILCRQAGKGKLVVRLKGGDPYVFGRGGEEAERLQREGIPFEVVPGVTSAIAALAYAGIPATHREAASSLHIITGHPGRAGAQPDYPALCRVGGTLVFLMAVTGLEDLAAGLLGAGMPGDTPAAVVENGTCACQRKVVGSLSHIAEMARKVGVQSPALLAVGQACRYSERLDWFEALPLAGRTVLVTRPPERAGALCESLRDLGAQVLAMPCIETKHTGVAQVKQALQGLGQYTWLALTSVQGVECLFEALSAVGKDARALAGVRIAAIGATTAGELLQHGIRADYVPTQYDAAHLAKGLVAQLKEGEKVLLLRAREGTPELPKALASNRVAYDDVAAYQAVPARNLDAGLLRRINRGPLDYVLFTSPSTVEGFSAAVPDPGGMEFRAVCIGQSTQAAARAKGYRTIKAGQATTQAMICAVLEAEQARGPAGAPPPFPKEKEGPPPNGRSI